MIPEREAISNFCYFFEVKPKEKTFSGFHLREAKSPPETKNPTVFGNRSSLIYQGFFSIVATGQNQMNTAHRLTLGL
jgi:hypothetical protein